MSYQEAIYNPRPDGLDLTATNSVAPCMNMPYGSLLFRFPTPPETGLSADTSSSDDYSDETLLDQVLIEFAAELDAPMSAQVIANIEAETPEILAINDPATREYE
ncbi:MAG: hypothetical protein ABII68_12275 [Pseudomonadota bacterium]